MPPKKDDKKKEKASDDTAASDAAKKLHEAYGKRTAQAKERQQPPHPVIELAIKTSIKVWCAHDVYCVRN